MKLNSKLFESLVISTVEFDGLHPDRETVSYQIVMLLISLRNVPQFFSNELVKIMLLITTYSVTTVKTANYISYCMSPTTHEQVYGKYRRI